MMERMMEEFTVRLEKKRKQGGEPMNQRLEKKMNEGFEAVNEPKA